LAASRRGSSFTESEAAAVFHGTAEKHDSPVVNINSDLLVESQYLEYGQTPTNDIFLIVVASPFTPAEVTRARNQY
jgi:hypothetical protein